MRHRQVCSAPGRRVLPTLALGALVFALALGGCGGSGGDSTGGGTDGGATAAAGTSATSVGGAGQAPSGETGTTAGANGAGAKKKVNADAAIAAGACGPQLDEFLADLEGLRRNLVVGVSYEQYVSELGVLRKLYDRIPVEGMSLACLSGAADSAEQSFDGYLQAANTWGDCVADSECETAEVEPKLQHKWGLAAQQLKRAQTAAG